MARHLSDPPGSGRRQAYSGWGPRDPLLGAGIIFAVGLAVLMVGFGVFVWLILGALGVT